MKATTKLCAGSLFKCMKAPNKKRKKKENQQKY